MHNKATFAHGETFILAVYAVEARGLLFTSCVLMLYCMLYRCIFYIFHISSAFCYLLFKPLIGLSGLGKGEILIFNFFFLQLAPQEPNGQ